MEYRHLTIEEIDQLKNQACHAADWDRIMVREGFDARHVISTRFSGDIRMGRFDRHFELAGGMRKHSGLYHATLHNVEIGDNCCIENVKNYIANYRIGQDSFIENVDIIINDGLSTFGNGVEVRVLSETGGREVMIHDKLTAQQAYMMALYRHRPELVGRLRELISEYAEAQRPQPENAQQPQPENPQSPAEAQQPEPAGRSGQTTPDVPQSPGLATIGSHVRIADAGYIKDVRIGDWCRIEGASRLYNGSINGNADAPVHIGVGVIGDDFIISSGSSIEDGVCFSRCFIGQACRLGHNYSATDSLFFSNCQGENGEACSIFAGPFTVTHHKSTLLIAGMFSFMNAGSGSNQSNHMYKLGPIHQGIMERGAKTASDSYVLWPAKVGSFSLVMGRHTGNLDTSDLPFSYLIENHSCTYIVPGANLKSVGTIRDAKKWPVRDARKDPERLDCINFNLLSPYTIQKMFNGIGILERLREASGGMAQDYSFQRGKINAHALENGIGLYKMAIRKFLGNSLIHRLEGKTIPDDAALREALKPDCAAGLGRWVDLGGMIAPKSEVDRLMDEVESGAIGSIAEIGQRLNAMHRAYYDMEWTWAYRALGEFFGIDMAAITREQASAIVDEWQEAVVGIDRLVYEDARKEFSLSSMTSFGADGDELERDLDFMEVRGGEFEANPVVAEIRDHIRRKTALGNELRERLK